MLGDGVRGRDRVRDRLRGRLRVRAGSGSGSGSWVRVRVRVRVRVWVWVRVRVRGRRARVAEGVELGADGEHRARTAHVPRTRAAPVETPRRDEVTMATLLTVAILCLPWLYLP